jgi:hypothetical protein
MRGFSVALVMGVLLAGPALAASPMGQLKDVDGKVYVNRGKGFVLARGDTELYQGDRVMVGEKGSATVNYYLAECDVMLTASSMTTIAGKAPCKGGSTSSSYGQTVGGEGGVITAGGAVVVGLGVAGSIGAGVLSPTGSDETDNADDVGQSP